MTGQASEESFLTPSPALPLRGDEQFTGVDATVIDFWRWAFSDLRDNTTRGILAEFLVSKAVGDAREMRIGWGNFDALAPDGTKIEVKCSAFLQSWTLQRLSELRFGRLRAREFDADRNELSADVRVRADVFVFAVQAQQDPASYDMLDIGHWEFWVASADAVRESTVRTVGSAGSGSMPEGRSPTVSLQTRSALLSQGWTSSSQPQSALQPRAALRSRWISGCSRPDPMSLLVRSGCASSLPRPSSLS
jgi:hypothetical protein